MKKKKNNLHSILKKNLSSAEIRMVPSSFDVLGGLLIFSDFPESLVEKEKIIGEALLEVHSNVKTVLRKVKQYSGRYRLPKYKVIAGEKSKETLYKENGVLLWINPEKVYFSSRLANERLRLAKLVGKGERVLVMFSGCGVYPLVISKNSYAGEIIGVEINPEAHDYAKRNAELNKTRNVVLFKEDVRGVVPKIKGKFDRIVMPLPKGAEGFLDLAFGKIKRGGVVHLYLFWNNKDSDAPRDIVSSSCRRSKRKCRIVDVVSCGAYSPGTNRYCVDFKVE